MTDDDDNAPEAYVTDDELAALNSERAVFGADGKEETFEDQSRRLLRENAPLAVQTVLNIARSGASDRVRLDASKYLLDRVLGKVGDDAYGGAVDPLTDFLNKVGQHANGKKD